MIIATCWLDINTPTTVCRYEHPGIAPWYVTAECRTGGQDNSLGPCKGYRFSGFTHKHLIQGQPGGAWEFEFLTCAPVIVRWVDCGTHSEKWPKQYFLLFLITSAHSTH